MIFQFTLEKVLSREKTQTRRLVVPRTIQPMYRNLTTGEMSPSDSGESDGDWFYNNAVWHAKPCEMGKGFWGLNYTEARPKYRIGSTYAVSPGRGKKAVGRIEITGIRREDVRGISWDDAIAEGFESPLDFLGTWVQMHDRRVAPLDMPGHVEMLPERPAEKYQAWVLEFRLVQLARVEPAG